MNQISDFVLAPTGVFEGKLDIPIIENPLVVQSWKVNFTVWVETAGGTWHFFVASKTAKRQANQRIEIASTSNLGN